MKMKKMIKVFIVVILFLNCISISQVYASDEKIIDTFGETIASTSTEGKSKTDWRDGFKYADEFTDGKIEWSEEEKSNPNIGEIENTIKKDSSSIFSFLLMVGTSLTVIIGAVLGIKFMMASAEDKAKIKEQMMPYVIGCIVIYGAVTIWYITVQILEKI